jgi:hypothetical protein
MVDNFLSLPVAYYAYLLNIFDSFLRLQNSCRFRQKHDFFRSLIMELSVETKQCRRRDDGRARMDLRADKRAAAGVAGGGRQFADLAGDDQPARRPGRQRHHLQNLGEAPVYGQVRVYLWEQKDGDDVLTPTQEVVASPPIIQIGPRPARPSGWCGAASNCRRASCATAS